MKCVTVILFFFSSLALRSQELHDAGKIDLSSVHLDKLAAKKASFEFNRHSNYVFVFLSPECPLSINYTKTLNALSTRYGKSVIFVGIVPGNAYNKKSVLKFQKEYKMPFDIFIDRDFELSRLLNATVTPEVVLLSKESTVAYQGAIDDWAISLGKKKIKPTKLYLQSAIEQQLLGQDVVIKKTNPVGCLINDF